MLTRWHTVGLFEFFAENNSLLLLETSLIRAEGVDQNNVLKDAKILKVLMGTADLVAN